MHNVHVCFTISQVNEWPLVNFFSKKKKFWTMNDTRHSVIPGDVVDKLEIPEITMAGSRLYYNFKVR